MGSVIENDERLPPGPARQALIDQLVAQGKSFAEVGQDPRIGVSKQRVGQVATAAAQPRRPMADNRRDLKVHQDVSARFGDVRDRMHKGLPDDHPRKLDATGRRMGLTVNAAVVALLDFVAAAEELRGECPRLDEILRDIGL